MIDAAVAFGQLICVLDPDEARARDEALLADYRGSPPLPTSFLHWVPGRASGRAAVPSPPSRRSAVCGSTIGSARASCCAPTSLVDPSGPAAAWWDGHGVVARRPVAARAGRTARRARGVRRPARPLRTGARHPRRGHGVHGGRLWGTPSGRRGSGRPRTTGARRSHLRLASVRPRADRPPATGGRNVDEPVGRRFDGRVAIVTGASTDPGIGTATARRLAREGASVVINARRAPRLEAMAATLVAEGLRVVAVARCRRATTAWRRAWSTPRSTGSVAWTTWSTRSGARRSSARP